MFVSRARYDQMSRQCEREAAARVAAERKLDEKDVAIARMQGLVEHHRDQHPDAPINYPAPSPETVRLKQQLSLSEKARRALDDDRSELIGVNVQLTREVRELREALAAATAPAEGSAA
ncbi:hypothetical protein RFN58_07135 [Streptomyces iakyrus]|uniref:hypothetical protein n=1 Tax=Streptomyces iakyrus TaxID=68219 RepID=UPI000525473A|nr:hypothetical protein [Streptomyces iakyrus]